MLLDFNSIANTFNIEPRGVFHVGAHYGQEIDLYESMGIKNVVIFSAGYKETSCLLYYKSNRLSSLWVWFLLL